jgi:hypothetical protein
MRGNCIWRGVRLRNWAVRKQTAGADRGKALVPMAVEITFSLKIPVGRILSVTAMLHQLTLAASWPQVRATATQVGRSVKLRKG